MSLATRSKTVAQLASCDVGELSDALDLLGLHGAVESLARQSGARRAFGPAFTVQFEPVRPGERGPAADYIDDVPTGSVIVLAAGGAPCTVWGDLLSEVALARGIAGTVIDGLCRDVDRSNELGYPVWARGAWMRSGKNRVRMVATEERVQIGPNDQVTVRPGDIVTADGSGVLVIPSDRMVEVAAAAVAVRDREAAILQDVRSGMGLAQARIGHGYHELARDPNGSRP